MIPYVKQLAQDFPELRYYEFPTLPETGLIYRTFLDEGMRADTPEEAGRRRKDTLYLNKPASKNALNIDDEKDIRLYIFERSDDLLWRSKGIFTKEKGEALRNFLNQSKQESHQS